MGYNKYGVNSDITYELLFDNEMREAGFIDTNSSQWVYHKKITFPKELDKGCNYSFNIAFPRDIINSNELKIEVRDEDLNIPYDYYDILIRSAKDKIANIVYKFVEKEMLELKRKGIILGHYKGREIFHAEKPAPYDFDVL